MTLSLERPERRLKLTLQYDGAGFKGWQVQPGARTVQSELEAALSRLADARITVVAAGRTDSGVHATGQVVSTSLPAKWTAAALRRSLNAILPFDIWVAAVQDVPAVFHARNSATARSYTYRVGMSEAAFSPFERRWCWALKESIDAGVLHRLAPHLIGRRSMRGFAKAGQEARGEYCEVSHAEWRRWEHGVAFEVTANRFLHHTVRYLVGTMIDIAGGKRPETELAALLMNAPRVVTSQPAPPEGLFLSKVHYPPALDGHEESSE